MVKGWREGGKKNRVAYNSYIQRDRLQKFHKRKKEHARYKRACRFEARSQTAASGSGNGSSLAQAWQRDADELEDEYERRLALSYGGATSSTKSAQESDIAAPPKKRRRRDIATEGNGEAAAVEAKENSPQEAPQRSRRRKRAGGAAATAPPSDAISEVQPGPSNESPKQDVGKKEKKKKKKQSKDGFGNVPGRYAKDLREFREKREAEAQERQKRYDEEMARKRQRKDTARGRAMKGQLLSQRTAWGQPKMSRMLEDITSKLGVEHQQRQRQPGQDRASSGTVRSR